MNTKSITISAIVAVVLVIAGTLVGSGLRPSQTTINNPVTEKTVLGGNQDFSNAPYIGVNGVNTWYVNTPFAIGTSTLCSIPNPLVSYAGASSTASTATSTLLYVAAHWTAATNTAITYAIGTSTSRNATTSSMTGSFVVPAGATSTSFGWIPPTWNAGLINSNVFVNLLADNNTGARATTSDGFCTAEYRQF